MIHSNHWQSPQYGRVGCWSTSRWNTHLCAHHPRQCSLPPLLSCFLLGPKRFAVCSSLTPSAWSVTYQHFILHLLSCSWYPVTVLPLPSSIGEVPGKSCPSPLPGVVPNPSSLKLPALSSRRWCVVSDDAAPIGFLVWSGCATGARECSGIPLRLCSLLRFHSHSPVLRP